jgi:hypothetical protein
METPGGLFSATVNGKVVTVMPVGAGFADDHEKTKPE